MKTRPLSYVWWLVLAVFALMLVWVWRSQGVMAHVQQSSYPQKPITLIVTFPPGGGTDLLARRLGAELEQKWRIPVVVENRPGASGNIGARFVADSKADGYTLVMVNSSFAINPAVFTELGFDPKQSFTPVINMAWIPSVVIVAGNSESTPLNQLFAPTAIKGVQVATCGNGTPQHLAAEMLSEYTKTEITHVPYRGCGPALADVIAGHVQTGIVTVASAMPFIESGSVKALALSAPERSELLPNVPTIAEQVQQPYALDQWHGILAPAHTPAVVIEKLNLALREIMAGEKIQDDLKNLGYTPSGSTAAEFKRIIDADIDRFAALIQRAQISIQ